jgi:pseudaminic acid synthase
MDKRLIRIAGREIGLKQPPFIIAEMSGNHNQSLERAMQIVEAAAAAGAHALKLQTYTADTMTIERSEGSFFISDERSPWKGKSLFELYQQAHTPWEWHEPLMRRASELGMIAFSTPFDATAVAFLESLKVPCYKVASFENADTPLISTIAATGKPMIISTGMAEIAELDLTVRTARAVGMTDLVLLKCTSSYPASAENSNLLTIPHMRALFDVEVGISDHTLGIGASIAAIALGATVIERHLTLSRAEGGVDAAFSLEPEEFKQLVREAKTAWLALGQISYGPTESERGSAIFRRSLYAVSDIKKGERFNNENVRSIRPGDGLPPSQLANILGKRCQRDIPRGTALSWDVLLNEDSD